MNKKQKKFISDYLSQISCFVLPEHIKVHLLFEELAEDTNAEVEIDYRYLRISLKIDIKEFIFDNITEILIHECCHYYTSSGRQILQDDKKYITNNLGHNHFCSLTDRIADVEENCNVLLERHFMELFKMTVAYRQFKKKYEA